MADSPISQLEAELEAAQVVLEPQLRGLNDLLGVSLSNNGKAAVDKNMVDRQRRYDLIQTAIDALAALEADGYPDLPNTVVPASLYNEFQEQGADIGSAIGIFVTDSMPATTMQLSLGAPQEKPKK